MTKYSIGSEEAGFFGNDLPSTELNSASRGQVIELDMLANAGNLAIFLSELDCQQFGCG
jgi:hypothetical protein